MWRRGADRRRRRAHNLRNTPVRNSLNASGFVRETRVQIRYRSQRSGANDEGTAGMRARKLLVAAIAATTLTTAGASAIATTDVQSHGGAAGRSDKPQQGFASQRTVLRDGKPAEVGLDPAPIAAAEQFLESWTKPDATGHPHFSGAVGLLAHDGVIVDKYAVGGALRYADGAGTELPADQQVPMRADTIFDMASISKLFTSIVTLQLLENHQIELTAP